jgi:F-type H+-transporting ATPase subunit delta
MRASLVAKVYAKALVEIGESSNSCDSLEDELRGLSKVLTSDPDVRDFLLSPRVSKKTKSDIIEKAFTENVSQTVLSFLLLIVINDRAIDIEQIIKQYIVFNDARKKLVRVTVLSAVKLGDSELNQIKEWFKSSGKANDCLIESEIKPEIIGGFVLEYADNIIDGSMKSKLSNLRNYILNDTSNLLGKDKIGAYYEN